MNFTLSTLRPDESPAVADLLHRSLVHWYESRLRQGARFGPRAEPLQVIPETYAVLDPGEEIVARESGSGALLGVCYVHPRETHHAIGIVASAPEAGGRGVARAMMEEAIRRAREAGRPVRLVSSLLNLDSFSLYTRLGFVPGAVYQDILFTVPATGLAGAAPAGVERVREARADEAAALADYEAALQGLRREKDYRFFLGQRHGQWKVWVSEDPSGRINGVLVANLSPASPMLGPGVIGEEGTAAAMIWTALNTLRGRSYVLLAPAAAAGLVATLYRWGGRNIELHVAQVLGANPPARALAFPTFLPESA